MNHMSTDSISCRRWTPSLPVVYHLRLCVSVSLVSGWVTHEHWDGDCVIHCTYLFAEDEANTSQEPRSGQRSLYAILKY